MPAGCVIYLHDFLAFVNREDYEAVVLRNDDAARERIAKALDGVDLYFHMFRPDFDAVGVTVNELIVHRIISRITLHASP